MQNSAMLWVGIATFLMVSVTIMVSMNFPFNWVFLLTVLGQVLLLYMVYKVLKDDYKTDKTFTDFYEDYPIGNRVNE